VEATTTLIASNATWRYLDLGTDQGAAWRNPSFNDSSWKTGSGKLGYGLGDETTVLNYGPNVGNKYITTYFRRAFFVPDPALVSSLAARIARDDGVVIYLNDVEVARDNMPGGGVSFSTLASTSVVGSTQTQFMTRVLSPSALVSGTNVLAVELHQDSPATPDARFEFELLATALVPSSATLKMAQSGNITTLSWPEAAGLLRVYSTTNLAPPVSWLPLDVTPSCGNGQCSVQLLSTTNKTQFFKLQTP
jgi:hypothetical protein